MQRTERHIIVKDENIKHLCFLSKNLYNRANYCLRQSFIHTSKIPSLNELNHKLLSRQNNADYTALPAQSANQCLQLLYKNWKSFFSAIKKWRKGKENFTGKPNLPKYKDKNGLNVVVFTNQQVKVKDGIINFPKKANIPPLKTKVKKLQQVRIIPQATCFVIEVIYEKEIDSDVRINEENFLSIDLGINNLATSINNAGANPFIVNGKPLKAINQFFNKERAKLQTFIGDKGTSNKIKKLTHKRNCKVMDFLHKTSRFIVDYACEHGIGTIIIGKNVGWKNGINLGKATNQKFTQIPFDKLIQQIQYKAEEKSIQVILTEENHTSKIDHLALEEIKHQENYLGKRVKRGLFKSSTNKILNADVNGAIGIARKVIGDGFLQDLIGRGLAFNPIKINCFNKEV